MPLLWTLGSCLISATILATLCAVSSANANPYKFLMQILNFFIYKKFNTRQLKQLNQCFGQWGRWTLRWTPIRFPCLPFSNTARGYEGGEQTYPPEYPCATIYRLLIWKGKNISEACRIGIRSTEGGRCRNICTNSSCHDLSQYRSWASASSERGLRSLAPKAACR